MPKQKLATRAKRRGASKNGPDGSATRRKTVETVRKPRDRATTPLKRGANEIAASPPASLGFSMAAEWERHEATWLAWPHNPTDWPDKLDTIRWVYGEMTRKIAPGELVHVWLHGEAYGQPVEAIS